MDRTTSIPTTRARAAFACIAAFPAIVGCLHVIQAGSYHPYTQAVSELALGRGGWLMTIAFCSLATGTLLLAGILRRLDSRPRVAPCLIAASALLTYGSAFIHADGPNSSTTHGQIHQALGVATFILLISGMFGLVRPFRRDPGWRSLATPTLIWGFAGVATFLLIPVSGAAYFGLAQRTFLTVVLGWALAVAFHAARSNAAVAADSNPVVYRAAARNAAES
jgi:hypothetical protein